ncbi:MAG: murein biosynthesis integral membrane protein MurJ [Chloroflexi bacterium]|nr:murein biosynthesis integral membrane protein MurJ [Chloroflexota bacterium]
MAPMLDTRPAGALARFLQRSVTAQSVTTAAGIVALGFLLSRLLGLVRSLAIAHAYGTDPELAAYWIAFRLPDLVFQVLAGATLSSAFIPAYSRLRMHGGEDAGWQLASDVLNLVAVATFAAAALAFALAPWLVPLLAPGLGDETGRSSELRALAVELTQLMLISPLLFGISGMVTGILNARQHFVAPALAPALYNLGIIVGALALTGPFGIRGLAYGVVAGSVGHLLVQLPALRAVGMRWHPTLALGSAGLREVLRLAGPRVVGLAATQLNFVVVLFFASFVSDAAISALSYAFLIAMLPIGVIGMAISTAAFPSLAEHAAARQLAALRDGVTRHLRMILFLALPASAAIAMLAQPGTRLLLQRGAFDASSTELVADALVLYAIGVCAHAAVEILSRGFYALADTRTPVRIAVLAVGLNLVLCAVLVVPFGIRGLAAATSISALTEGALLFVALEQQLGGLRARGLWPSAARTLAATALMIEVLVLLRLALAAAGLDAASLGGALAQCALGALLALATFVATAHYLRSPEYAELRARL